MSKLADMKKNWADNKETIITNYANSMFGAKAKGRAEEYVAGMNRALGFDISGSPAAKKYANAFSEANKSDIIEKMRAHLTRAIKENRYEEGILNTAKLKKKV